MSAYKSGFRPKIDPVAQHRGWLALVEVSGPFLSLPVLRRAWPTLDALEPDKREALRRAHSEWRATSASTDASADVAEKAQQVWLDYVLGDFLGWRGELRWEGLDSLAVEVAEHDETITPSFALVEPGTAPTTPQMTATAPTATAPTRTETTQPAEGSGDGGGIILGGVSHPVPAPLPAAPTATDKIRPDGLELLPGAATARDEIKPDAVRLLGLRCAPGTQPTARVPGSAWAATATDRLARLCRHHGVELGLATDGRWWALVWAPRGGVTTTAVFDAVSWPEAAERDVVRAFRSLLGRPRFFGVPNDEQLVPLLRASLDNQEDITEALGVQVRQAVELLVGAFGRADIHDRAAGRPGLTNVPAHEIYRAAVSVMMRVVFLLFAEERRLLPSDNELYASAYSAGRLLVELESQVAQATEEELEHSYVAWHRLRALFTAVHDGIDHPRLRIPAHDGSLFDPEEYPWLPLGVDDRTVLHMLRSVQHVTVGTGRNKELRTLSFRQLDVEQIGYVYEGLLSFEGFRADGVVVGLVGKEGLEEEVPLDDLVALAKKHDGRPQLAAALAERYKDSKIGSPRALEKRLAPLGPTEQEEARKKLLAVTEGDYPLAERLLPFSGILREDLRGLPVVILPGALYVTESKLRKNTGTHYTPRFLAEEIVEHALEPLLYHVGPLQTADKTQWTHRTSQELLQLKVADIAMGSAAFLVAAARYLGEALLDAWACEGKIDTRREDETRPLDVDEDPLVVDARRQIIEHCLYGVDINPMAVEMAKLSLWLVSMDAQRPFTFLDDRLVAGDSLFGVTSEEQIEYLHMDPKEARELREGTFDWSAEVRTVVAAAARERRRLTAIGLGDDPIAALERKRMLLEESRLHTGRLRLFADLVVGAALAGRTRRLGSRDPNARADFAFEKQASREGLYEEAIALAGRVAAGEEAAAIEKARAWLATDVPPDARTAGMVREPLHWPLVFPEVFEQNGDQPGGFDAVVGNPPFLGGQKLTGSLGFAYREYLVAGVGRGARGSADLVAYFVLRAHDVLNSAGQTGLIATNTLAQGDTREVGLDQLTDEGVTIRRAIKSKPWPSKSAVLEYCAVWTSRAVLGTAAIRVADGVAVSAITPSLEEVARVVGNPHRLAVNARLSFQGSNILGLGFTMDPERARDLLEQDSRNEDVLFPYLNGQDLNSDPGCAASRWVINFHDWPEDQAKQYPTCYRQVRELVKPERDQNNDRRRREVWWRFTRPTPELYESIAGLKRVVAITLVSKTVIPAMVPTGQVFAHKLGVFATDDTAMLALLTSEAHHWWARRWGSTLESRVNYSPSDVFETFPLPELTQEMRDLGDRLDTYRRGVMLARQSGLTKTYNLVFDPKVQDEDIAELRRIHKAIDGTTVRAYGWDDLLDQLDHGFHPAGRELRYTIGPAAQREILDRLLELNHARYAEEVAKGLHDKKDKKAPRQPAKPKAPAAEQQELGF